MGIDIKLAEIAEVLGCSVQAASYLKRGRYHEVARKSELPERYALLMRLMNDAREAMRVERICIECPRDDCTGCRVAEL